MLVQDSSCCLQELANRQPLSLGPGSEPADSPTSMWAAANTLVDGTWPIQSIAESEPLSPRFGGAEEAQGPLRLISGDRESTKIVEAVAKTGR